jgi:cysteine synthase
MSSFVQPMFYQRPRSYYSVAARLAREIPNSYHMNQYDNLANRLAHYESTGPKYGSRRTERLLMLFVPQVRAER